MRPGVVVGGIFVCAGVVQVVGGTHPAYRDQTQCKEWLRSGQHDTAEGVVADFHREAGRDAPTHFRVGDVRFSYKTYEPTTGGFRGGLWDEAADVEYTFYGLGTLALAMSAGEPGA